MCNGAYINIYTYIVWIIDPYLEKYGLCICTSNNNSRTSMRDMYIYTPQKKYLNQTEPNPLANSNISWNSPCKSKVLRLLKNSCCQKYQGFLLVVGYRWNRGGWTWITWQPRNLQNHPPTVMQKTTCMSVMNICPSDLTETSFKKQLDVATR